MKLENRKTYQRTIGVDVASKKLDLNDSWGKLPTQIANEPVKIVKHLARRITSPEETLVICESTGCYHEELVETMHDAGIAVVVANPRQVRDEILKERSKTDPRIERWSSVPGVGQVTVSAMVCEVPEIGELSRGGIAKLMGLAPMTNQSGQSDKKRPVRGGRSSVRSTLYMAALSATQNNEKLKAFYTRLVGKGKPKKLALIAVARKLLTILNQMARPEGQMWEANHTSPKEHENKKESSCVPSLN